MRSAPDDDGEHSASLLDTSSELMDDDDESHTKQTLHSNGHRLDEYTADSRQRGQSGWLSGTLSVVVIVALLTITAVYVLSSVAPLVPAFSFGISLSFTHSAQPSNSSSDGSRSPLTSLTSSSSHSWADVYTTYSPVCEASAVNLVWNRGDGYNEMSDILRNWSVSAQTFAYTQPMCNTSSQLLQAMARGVRKPLPGHEFAGTNLSEPAYAALPHNSTTWLSLYKANVEWSRSYFEPFQCAPRWLSADEVCAVLHKFSYVLFLGDSILRHISQGLFMLMTEDLQYGAIPRMSRQPGLFDTCRCDGQFSEHERCRTYEYRNMFNMLDPRVYGACSHSVDSSFAFSFELKHGGLALPADFETAFCNPDKRPRMIVANGAIHYQYDTNRVANSTLLRPLIERLQLAQTACPHPLRWRILFISATAQSRLLDLRYPHQVRERATQFNLDMAQLLAPMGLDMFDVWELTANAASSDGFHFLSDVNMQAANAILNLLDHYSKEMQQ